MKRTHLISVLVGVVAIGIFAADASAYYHPSMGRFTSRDPGAGAAMRTGAAGAAPVAQFIPRDQYRDGMNSYQYVRSTPAVYVDGNGTQATRPSAGAASVPASGPTSGSASAATSLPVGAGVDFMGPPEPPSPGKPIPGTAGNYQNCQGAACGIRDWVQPSQDDIAQMKTIGPEKWFNENFNPMKNGRTGQELGKCATVKCSKEPMMYSPCECGQREIVGWLRLMPDGRSDGHFIGRDIKVKTGSGIAAPPYESKAGGGLRWEGITDPDVHDDVMHGGIKPASNFKVCWCCTRSTK